eukprot:PhM_4_TR11511/c0_g1_i1/m.40820
MIVCRDIRRVVRVLFLAHTRDPVPPQVRWYQLGFVDLNVPLLLIAETDALDSHIDDAIGHLAGNLTRLIMKTHALVLDALVQLLLRGSVFFVVLCALLLVDFGIVLNDCHEIVVGSAAMFLQIGFVQRLPRDFHVALADPCETSRTSRDGHFVNVGNECLALLFVLNGDLHAGLIGRQLVLSLLLLLARHNVLVLLFADAVEEELLIQFNVPGGGGGGGPPLYFLLCLNPKTPQIVVELVDAGGRVRDKCLAHVLAGLLLTVGDLGVHRGFPLPILFELTDKDVVTFLALVVPRAHGRPLLAHSFEHDGVTLSGPLFVD